LKVGFRLPIPLGLGFKIIFELRFFQILLLAIVFYYWSGVTANDFLYLLTSGYFVALILGVVLPLLQVLEIKAECSVHEQLVVSERVEMHIKLSRRNLFGPFSFLMPVRSLRVATNLSRRTAGGQAGEMVLDPDPLLIASLDMPGWMSLPTPRLRRGIYFVEQVQLLTCFPLGIAWWSRNIKITQPKSAKQMQITVHPLVLPVTGNFLFQLLALRSSMGLSNSSSIIVPQSSSVRSVREFKPGDSIRHVHWPSSARQGKILVREFDSEQLPVFDVLLDLRASWKNQEQFEVAVCLIHSLMHLGYRMGIMPELSLNPPLRSTVVQKKLMFDLPQIPYGLDLVSEILARVEPIPTSMDNELDLPLTDEEIEADQDSKSPLNIRPLLTVNPLLEMKAKYSPTRGDHAVAPIELIAIPRNWEEEEEIKASKSRAIYTTHRPVGRPTSTKLLATIDDEEEFIGL
jgi:hypothetical protein